MRRVRARRMAGACALAATVQSVPLPAAAQEDHSASRTIDDTTFLLPALADSAFVLTEFGFRQGINYEYIPNFPVAGFTRYDLQWLQLEERVDLAVRITPWLGVYAQGLASGALGPDAPSLLFEGGGLDFGGKGGVVLRIYRNERTESQVALRAYAGGDAGRTLDLPDFFGAFALRVAHDAAGIAQQATSQAQVLGALKNEALTLADSNYTNVVLYRSSDVRAGGSLHYAQRVVGPLTVQLGCDIEQTWSQEQPFNLQQQKLVSISASDTTFTFDAVASASFSRWSVPLGVSVEYADVTTEVSLNGAHTSGLTTQYAGAGLWYTGRRGLEIGALAFTQRSLSPVPGYDTSQTSGKPSGYAGSLIFRALW